MITLVPADNPKGLQNSRPISLSNVQYKIIPKILPSRFRPIMAKKNLSSDNIKIEKEFFHQMCQSHRRKYDVHKAYDSVLWEFLKACLIHMGFLMERSSEGFGAIFLPRRIPSRLKGKAHG